MQLYVKRFHDLTAAQLYELLRLRSEVFVVEQQCIYQDIDCRDQQAIHLWLANGEEVAACLRILPQGVQDDAIAIGRVITRASYRGQGLGLQLMQAGIDAAVELLDAHVIHLEAQCYAQGFYEKLGFVPISEPFMEDGIPHVLMSWTRP